MNKLFDPERARNLMEKHGIDALVASSMDNFGYVTDYWSWRGKDYDIGWIGEPLLQLAVLPYERNVEPFILMVGNKADLDYIDPWIKDRRYYIAWGDVVKGSGDFFEIFSQVIKEKGLEKSRIGLETGYDGFTTDTGTALTIERRKNLLPQVKFKDASKFFREMRLIKTAEETDRIVKSSAIVDKVIKASFEEVTPGMTKYELEWVIRKHMAKDKVNVILLCLNSGDNDILRPTDKKLEQDTFIRIDVASKYKQYYGDAARSGVIGTPTAKVENAYRALQKTLEQTIESLELGMKCSDVFNATKKRLKEGGCTYEPPLVGHGTGLCVHEGPYLNDNDTIIQPGMVFTLEIMEAVGKGSWIGLENMVVCDKQGCRNITTLDSELVRI